MHYASDLSFLKADAFDGNISGARIRTHDHDPKSECVTHYTTAPNKNAHEKATFSSRVHVVVFQCSVDRLWNAMFLLPSAHWPFHVFPVLLVTTTRLQLDMYWPTFFGITCEQLKDPTCPYENNRRL